MLVLFLALFSGISDAQEPVVKLELLDDVGLLDVVSSMPGLYRTSTPIKLKLTVENNSPNLLKIDMDDTPLQVLNFEGNLAEDFFAIGSDTKWLGIETEFAELLTENERLPGNCFPMIANSEIAVEITLGEDGNDFAFTQGEGKAAVAFGFNLKTCDENDFILDTFAITTNSVIFDLRLDTSAEAKVGGFWSRTWEGNGHVETDENGIFYWVSTKDDPDRTWTHPMQPRTYTFTSGDNLQDCSSPVTYNDVTKTQQEWVADLEADKLHFCGAAMWNTKEKTEAFYSQWSLYFGEFTDEKYEEWKGILARLCSADGYEYNCNSGADGTCNMGLQYRACESIYEGQEYPQTCAYYDDDIPFIKQDQVHNLPKHEGMGYDTLLQDMVDCSFDMRDCNDGDTPSFAHGGVVAHVSSMSSGKRVINICPICFWMGWRNNHCRVSDVIEQHTEEPVLSDNKRYKCLTSTATVIFHELGHFNDIADAGHEGELDNTVAISYFMAGIGPKPSQAPTVRTTTDKPTKRPSSSTECIDSSSCGPYANFISGNHDYWCGNLFGASGTYCAYYGICCPVSCGECTPEAGEPSVSPTINIHRYTHELKTWTHPSWLHESWTSFGISTVSTNKESLAQSATLLEFYQQNEMTPIVFVGLIAFLCVLLRKRIATSSYGTVNQAEEEI